MNAEARAAARARIDEATDEPWTVAESGHNGRLVWGIGIDYDPSDPTGQTPMQTQEIVAQQIVRTFDAEFIAHARTDLPAALDAIDRVLALHKNSQVGNGCIECTRLTGRIVLHPCDTVRATEGAS